MTNIKTSRDIFMILLLKERGKNTTETSIGIFEEIAKAHFEWRELVNSWWPMDIDSSFDIGEAGA